MESPTLGVRVTDTDKVQRLRKLVLSCASSELEESMGLGDSFPFVTPSFVRRGDLQQLRNNKYWVAEKSDGERMLLLSVGPSSAQDEGVYLVSDDFAFFYLSRAQLWLPSNMPQQEQKNQHKTLLDCMVVFNHHFGRYALMILDVYTVEGRRLNEVCMTERITAIREQIVKPLRNPVVERSQTVPVLGKEYHPLEKISNVIAYIKDCSDELGPRFIFQSATKNRFNENDGVIFIPDNEPLLTGPQPLVKKWKWPRLLSVKFHIRPYDKGSHRLYSAYYLDAEKRLEFYRQLDLTPSDAELVDKALAEHGLQEGVFDFHYDTEVAEWRYNRPRFDSSASDAYAVMLQLEQTASSFSARQLVELFDEKFEKSRAQPGTPHSPAAASAPQARPTTQRYPSQGRTSASGTPTYKPSPVHVAPVSSHPQRTAQPLSRHGDEEEVLQTPSPSPPAPSYTSSIELSAPLSGGLKRARPDSPLLEQPEGKRPRTE